MADTVCTIGRRYIAASFNGVPFTVMEADSEHGRRGAEGEFPFGENTAYADLGRKIRIYSLSARFDGDDHILQAAALIAACEMPGPGILVHPTRGVVSAGCRSLRVNDKIEEEAGVTYIDLEFVEGNAWPNGLSFIGQLLGLAIGAIIGTSRDSFLARYEPNTLSPLHRSRTVATAQAAVTQIADRYEGVLARKQINNIKNWRSLSDLREISISVEEAATPALMDRALTLGANALAMEIEGIEQYNEFRGLANWAAKNSNIDDEDAVYTHVRVISMAYMAQAATEAQYSYVREALAAMDTVVAISDSESSAARIRCDNCLQLGLAKFKTDAQTALYNKAYNLPRIAEYNFNGSTHPLTAAYAIYGDAKRHRELEKTNVIDAYGKLGFLVAAGTNQ